VIGAVGDIDWYQNSLVDTRNTVNLLAFSTLVQNTRVKPGEIWQEWIRNEFGEKAIPRMKSAFERTEIIIPKIFYTLGFYFMSARSQIPSFSFATNNGRIEFDLTVVSQWDSIFHTQGEKIVKLDPKTMQKIGAEKEEAVALTQQSLIDLNEAFALEMIGATDYHYLKNAFSKLLTCAQIWEKLSAAVFYFKHFRFHGTQDFYEKTITAIENLEQFVNELTENHGPNFRITQGTGLTTTEQLHLFIQDLKDELGKNLQNIK
ncbi:hypothetical protein JW964_20925, partial [candidate division KSB1 bacterium]|nr:hypothetical protein [candidate division KSB1 bacterium]